MFLKIYWLGAALALMPLPTQPQEVHRPDLFPYITEDINNRTFPFNLTATTNSDMVLVKCPDSDYRHKHNDEMFGRNSKVFIHESIFSPNGSLFAWLPLLRNVYGSTNLKCGRIHFIGDGNPRYDWTYNVIWKNDTINTNFMKRELRTNQISQRHENCNSSNGKQIIFGSKKEGGFLLMKQFQNIQNFYVNQMFYYFEKFNSSERIKVPCGVTKIYGYAPEIKLRTPESILVLPTIGKILKVNSDGKDQQVIEVVLDMEGNTEYYRGEKITLGRMRFVDGNELQVIENSTISITSSFTINGYEIIKLVYNFIDENGSLKVIEKKYYFAPLEKDFIIKEEIIPYLKNNTSINPNCSVYYLNVGHLDKVDYNGTKGSLQTFNSTDGIKGKFKIVKTSIIFDEMEDGKTTISCTYKTLDGSITTTTTFINKDTVTLLNKQIDVNKLNESTKHNDTGKSEISKINEEPKETKDSSRQKFEESNKSWYENLSKNIGKTNTTLLIVGFILLILIIIVVPLIILCKKWIYPYFKMIVLKKKYINVYLFWNDLTSQEFDIYCKNIKNKKYLSDKILKRKVIRKMEGGEEVDVGYNDIFDESLVKCYENLPRKIKAHYVYTDSVKRKYILSDGPTAGNYDSFWQMIFEEDICTIIAITNDKNTGNASESLGDIYWNWKTDDRKFGNIDVSRAYTFRTDIIYVLGIKFNLKRGDELKHVDVIHVSNWKENEIPLSDYQLICIYQEIIKKALEKNILIHSPQGTGSRVYILAYFLCICDALENNNDTYSPFKIIKRIREQRYGGGLTSHEFAFIIKAIVNKFIQNKILIDFSERKGNFYINYDDFFYKYLKRNDTMDERIRKFSFYATVINKGETFECDLPSFFSLGKIDADVLPKCIKRFQNAVVNHQNGKDKKRCRFNDIPCLDAHGITINGKLETEKDSFIHANMFEYSFTSTKKRKMILCQAPLEETIDDMLDMIQRYNVKVVVILVSFEEAEGPEKKWVPYFPQKDPTFETVNFCVSKLKFKKMDKDFISETECLLKSKNGLPETKFTILHYQGWPNHSIPYEPKSINALYKRIISFDSDDCMAIHCSAGVGRTGTLALIIYFIDTLIYFDDFSPWERLSCLREHRYLAVQDFDQYLFAIYMIFEYYSKEIKLLDPEIAEKYLGVANHIFKKEKGTISKKKE
uniref:Tyrosine-protein phosphatase domain-containing protein n=1 Tax=Strongyloides venezuelensis TaxID=75913 RepID=A0A0K0F3D6_STRVS